jgi:hypothetical protein
MVNGPSAMLEYAAWGVTMVASLIWVARDARKRRKGAIVVLLCLLTWPIGVFIWLLLRPKAEIDVE